MKNRTAARKSGMRDLLIAAACLAFLLLLVTVIVPSFRLSRGKALYASGDYERAYALLKGLDEEDAGELAAECLFRAQKARLRGAAVGETVRFGAYEQDNKLWNGTEEIEWLVLAVDGNKALLLSKYGLVARVFNEELSPINSYKRVTWSNCQLRSWLNGDFFRTAFSDGHQALILASEVKAYKNPEADVNPGRDTKDRVFLLSAVEARLYFDSDAARQCFPTAACRAQTEDGKDGAIRWWLRTSGVEESSVSVVSESGAVFPVGFSCGHEPYPAVRPAMWIDLGGT